ncbi:hypothetical protein SH661x_002390 [Planctomicrobium sp. SH661]|uniref:hypothetical protein n=1 Tax=Planctomicrobium sp. SH661 TaxID=3448124 RepID=UPI003F5B690A
MSILSEEYHAQGISFRYPKGWELTEEPRDDAFTVSVTDVGSYWSVTILSRRPRAQQVLDEATEAFEQEYEDVDDYPATAVINGMEAQARNLEFVSMELINCVFLRAVEVGGRTLFVMSQVTDHERSEYESLFEEISDSLKVDNDELIEIE